MRHVIVFLLLALAFGAPQANGQENSSRTLWLKIVNEKGKPIKKTGLIYQIGDRSAVSKTGKDGLFSIGGITDTDTVTVLVSGYHLAVLPAAGLDSIQVVLAKSKETPDDVNIGYQSISPENSTLPVTQLKPDRQIANYPDLASYLQGRNGLMVKRGGSGLEVVIRGGAPTSFYGSSAALIILDGVTFSNFDMVNNLVSPNDVKSVSILKDGSIYGSQGANGVVIITTKRGRE